MTQVRAAGRDPAARPASSSSRRRPSSPRRCATQGYEACRRPSRATSRSSGSSRCATSSGRLVYALPGAADLDRLERARPRRCAAGRSRIDADRQPARRSTTPPGFATRSRDAIDERRPRATSPARSPATNTILVAARDGVTGAELARRSSRHHLEGDSMSSHRGARLLGRARHVLRDRLAEGGLRLRRGRRRARRRRPGRPTSSRRSSAATRPARRRRPRRPQRGVRGRAGREGAASRTRSTRASTRSSPRSRGR